MMVTLNRHKYKTGRRFFRSLISLGIIIAIILTYRADVLSDVSMADYTAYPPFAVTLVKPNVLINLDTSTSLGYFAYDFDWSARAAGGTPAPPVSKGFNPANSYYGYYESDKKYSYSSGEFVENTIGSWDGNFLNWLTMRRSDIIKKVLIGGKTKSRAGMTGDAYDLVGDPPYANSKYLGYQKQICVTEDGNLNPSGYTPYSDCPLTFTFDNDEGEREGGKGRRWWDVADIPAFSKGITYTSSSDFKVVVHRGTEPEGIIQRVGDNVRWGLEVMNNGYWTSGGRMGGGGGGGGCHDGGKEETGGSGKHGGHDSNVRDVAGGTVLVPVGYNNIDDKVVALETVRGMVTEIAAAGPYTPSTPIAESVWTATGYFQQYAPTSSTGPRYFSGQTDRGRWGRGWRWGPRSTAESYPVGDDVDPYNYAIDPATDTIWAPCAKSYVITITDGESTKDISLPTTQKEYGSTYANTFSNPPSWADTANNYFWDSELQGSHYVDNVALWSHVDIGNSYRDLRSDATLPGEQNLTHYFIYAHFGSGTPDGKRLLNYSGAGGGGAARNGGFIDRNGNFLPDHQSEYDADGDGNNDTFFNVQDGNQLEAALTSAVFDIVNRASSGTATSILANTINGEGAVYQAYFYPEKEEGTGTRKWLGYIHALFVDKNGNLREDNNNNGVLDSADNIIKMGYSSGSGTEIYKCAYTNEDSNDFTCPADPEADGFDSLNPIWDGGEYLWKTAPAARKIYTTIDGSTLLAGKGFHPDNSSALMPRLRAADTTESDNIINWIRGDDLTGTTDSGHPNGYRQRSLTLTVNGTTATNVWKLGDIIHSTPSVAGKPMENYDLLYGDGSYTAFRSKYLRTRQVVYAGANDGMLHAFNAGCFDEAGLKYYSDVSSSGNCTSGAHSLGEELWAFVPRGLLPHLKWLTDPGYTHVYYVDLKPKIIDTKIFTADTTTHINGWGTILIGGFRYGGKDISWTSGSDNYSASPEYFALDITDPLNPRLLWTFSAPGLGLSMTYPSVARVCDSNKKNCNWYAIFGSGATDYDASSNLTGFQAGNVFVLKISGGTNGVIDTWTENTNFWKIPTGTGVSTAFMADPITVDVDIDYDVDVIYIGENYDNGNWNALLHRITTNKGMQTNPADWTISTVANINTIAGANDAAKRITTAPSVAMDERAHLWVFFGTGQFLGASDKNQTDTGAFYAIKDGCWAGASVCTSSYTNLMNMSIATVDIDGTVSVGTTKYTTWQEFLNATSGYSGWAIYFNSRGEAEDFTGETLNRDGERVFTKPLVLGGLVIWGSFIPEDDLCSYEGESNVYVVYYKTGTAYEDYVFIEQKDAADVVAGGGSTTYDIVKVARVKRLEGKVGMPSSVSAGITKRGTIKGFVGLSTGGIVEFESSCPISLKSEIINWSNKTIP